MPGKGFPISTLPYRATETSVGKLQSHTLLLVFSAFVYYAIKIDIFQNNAWPDVLCETIPLTSGKEESNAVQYYWVYYAPAGSNSSRSF